MTGMFVPDTSQAAAAAAALAATTDKRGQKGGKRHVSHQHPSTNIAATAAAFLHAFFFILFTISCQKVPLYMYKYIQLQCTLYVITFHCAHAPGFINGNERVYIFLLCGFTKSIFAILMNRNNFYIKKREM